MDRLHRLTSSPVLRDVRLEPIGWQWELDSLAPAKAPDVFVDRPTTIFGRYNGSPDCFRLRVTATDVGAVCGFDRGDHLAVFIFDHNHHAWQQRRGRGESRQPLGRFSADANHLIERQGDSDGEKYWSGQLAQGQTRLQAAQGIAGSAENNTQLINADYFHYLGRAADPDGLDSWLGQFAARRTNEDLIAGFTGSAAYYQEHTQ